MIRDLTAGTLCAGLGTLLPLLFQYGGLWDTYLPMFLPILAAGLLTRPPVAIAAGLTCPLLLSMITGIPSMNPPHAATLAMAGFALAGSASIVLRYVHPNPFVASLVGIAAGRWSQAVTTAMLSERLGFSSRFSALGILIQEPMDALILLLLAPGLFRLIEYGYTRSQDTPY
jgi:hypothetical protein